MSIALAVSADRDCADLRRWSFLQHAADCGVRSVTRESVRTLQLNLGRVCNQACRHCHVGAGPQRTEVMGEAVAEQALAVLAANPAIAVVDLTGGAPELCPSFRRLVRGARALGREVIDRSNLTILLEPQQEDLAAFLAGEGVHVVASLPCYSAENVDSQRGSGVFARSIAALRRLGEFGYGRPGSGLELDLVHNPAGPFLPPSQLGLEQAYAERLGDEHGILFNRLLTLTNLPIRRFADRLRRAGELESYMDLLVRSFNPATVHALMCRSLLSVRHDGRLFDCDFNQMLNLPLGAARKAGVRQLEDVDSLAWLTGESVAVGGHCFGCTAGAGSSCGGALAPAEI